MRLHYVNGSELLPETKREVLNAYGYRWTHENRDRALRWHGRKPSRLAPVSDAIWLAGHAFAVRKDGKLDGRQQSASPACLADNFS